MKICQAHWEKLREAIEGRGLMHLVAKNATVATKNVVAALDGSGEPYDPLMAANFSIWSVSLRSFGMGLMLEGAPCPLCLKNETEKNCTDPDCKKQSGEDWIQFAADEQLDIARERGLVLPPN